MACNLSLNVKILVVFPLICNVFSLKAVFLSLCSITYFKDPLGYLN